MQSFRKGRKGQFHSVYSIFRFRVAANPVKNVKYDKTQSQEHVELETIAQTIAAYHSKQKNRLNRYLTLGTKACVALPLQGGW